MKLLIVLFLVSGCSSYVAVKYSTCDKVVNDIYKCEEVK